MNNTRYLLTKCNELAPHETCELVTIYKLAYGRPNQWNMEQRTNFRLSLREILTLARAERLSTWTQLTAL